MGTMSYIFFGLMLIPLLILLVWMIKQDKKRSYIGLSLLIVGIIIAAYTIIKLDQNFVKEKMPTAPKASSFR
jgi:lipoprotein signal peptidase